MDATSSDSQDHLHSAQGIKELCLTETLFLMKIYCKNFLNSSLKQFILNSIHNIITAMKLYENFISFVVV